MHIRLFFQNHVTRLTGGDVLIINPNPQMDGGGSVSFLRDERCLDFRPSHAPVGSPQVRVMFFEKNGMDACAIEIAYFVSALSGLGFRDVSDRHSSSDPYRFLLQGMGGESDSLSCAFFMDARGVCIKNFTFAHSVLFDLISGTLVFREGGVSLRIVRAGIESSALEDRFQLFDLVDGEVHGFGQIVSAVSGCELMFVEGGSLSQVSAMMHSPEKEEPSSVSQDRGLDLPQRESLVLSVGDSSSNVVPIFWTVGEADSGLRPAVPTERSRRAGSLKARLQSEGLKPGASALPWKKLRKIAGMRG